MAHPFYFGSSERALFGWYHPPAPGTARGIGVVLCNTIGNEAIGVAQRTLLYAAGHLAQAGFSVLRFEFHGNGDSAGDQSDPHRVSTWLEDIDLAIAELRSRSGAKEVSLVGLRMGATLALAAAARREDISDIVLWDPYLSGKKYVDSMSKLHRLFEAVSALPQKWPDHLRDAQGEKDGKEALGFQLSQATIADLDKINLLEIKNRPARSLILISPQRTYQNQGGEKFIAQMQALGTQATWVQLPDPLSRDIQLLTNESHRQIASDLASHVAKLHEHQTAALPETPEHSPGSSTRSESPILFGEGESLFGILHSPRPEDQSPDRPVVITMVQRLGPNRNYVGMARMLSQLGFHVLRMDLSGRGDSLVDQPEKEDSPYPEGTFADVREAMAFLEKHLSAKRFVIAGLCSGADLAFQSVLQSVLNESHDEPRIAGLVMINPRTFAAHDIPTLETLVRSQDLGRFMGKFLDKKNWLKLLGGEFGKSSKVGKFDTKSPLGKLLDAVKLKIRGSARQTQDSGGIKSVPSNFKKLAQRGIDTFLVVREGDLGITYVDANCGKAMRALEGSKKFRRVTIREVDHNFTTLYAQQELLRAIKSHFAEVHLGS